MSTASQALVELMGRSNADLVNEIRSVRRENHALRNTLNGAILRADLLNIEVAALGPAAAYEIEAEIERRGLHREYIKVPPRCGPSKARRSHE